MVSDWPPARSRRRAASRRKVSAVSALILVTAVGCKPALEDTVSIVTTPRVLAIQSENDAGEAEFAAGRAFRMTALYVDKSGLISPSPLSWAFCNAAKPLAELGQVSPLCLEANGSWFTPLGVGNPVAAVMPQTACQQFGPEPVTPEQRPVDPDPTGGYYQPVQLLGPPASGTTGAPPAVTIGETRAVCTLASPSADVRIAFASGYQRNRNPAIATFGVKGEPTAWIPTNAFSGPVNHVGVGQRIELEVSWPACPLTLAAGGGSGSAGAADGAVPEAGAGGPGSLDGGALVSGGADGGLTSAGQWMGCHGAEPYLVLDPSSQSLVEQREAIGVAWYATGGSFDVDRSGRARDDPATTSDNEWQTPSAPGLVTMWIVLRDERGGAGWNQYAVEVR